MLSWTVRLTRTPFESDAVLDDLRAHGFSDAALLDICQVAAYYNYVNRLADGLGVALEPDFDERQGELTATPEEFDAWRRARAERRTQGG